MSAWRWVACVALTLCLTAACSEFPESPAVDVQRDASAIPDAATDGNVANNGANPDAAGDIRTDPEQPDLPPDTKDDVGFDTPGPGGSCGSHEECNDGRWCNGIEYCVAINGAPRGVCTVGTPVDVDDNIPCTFDTCVECALDDADCERGLEGTVRHDPTEACACVQNEDCEDTPCSRGVCVDGSCGLDPVDDAVPCDHPCGESGACFAGVCELVPEGPVQSATCSDGRDNDCSGAADDGPGCMEAQEVTVTGAIAVGPAGMNAEGVTVDVAAWTDGPRRMPSQANNLYCTARRVLHTFPFSAQSDLDSELITVSDGLDPGTAVRMGVQGAQGGTGLQLCTGRGLVLGPFTFDDLQSSLRVSLTAGDTANQQDRPTGDHALVVSYSTPDVRGAQGEQYLAAAAWSGSPITFDTTSIDFVIERPSGSNLAWVRLDAWAFDVAPETRGCFWVGGVTITSIRRVVGGERRHAFWASGETVEDFENRDPQELVGVWGFTEGTHNLEIGYPTRLVGNAGLAWDFDDTDWAAMSMPRVIAGPALLDRTVPLIAEFGMSVEAATASRPTSFGMVIQGPGLETRKIAAATLNGQLAHVANLQNIPEQDRRQFLYRLALPEAAKTLGGLDLIWVLGALDDPAGRVLLDDLSLFFHHEDRGDVSVSTLPAAPGDDVQRFTIRGRLPGRYEVRCHWQVPLSTRYETVSSSPGTIVLE